MCVCLVVPMISEIDRASDALFYIDAGCSREDWIRIGMAAKASGLSFDDFHSWSATAGNYSSEKECHTVWQSFKAGGGVTSSTLYAMAYESGWTDSNTHVKSPRPSLSIVKPKISPHTPIVQATHANALQVWNDCIPATLAEGYIHRKQGIAEGLRVYPASAKQLIIRNQNVAGYLVVPCWSSEKLQTLQFIPQGEGAKLNLPSASFNDGFFTVGTVTDKVYICEGIGQAWAINKSTGHAAIVCFGAGRINRVTEIIRAEMPIIKMVLVPDAGKEIQAIEIATSLSCGYIELPEGSPKNYDVSDYLIEHGASALADLLRHVKAPAIKYKMLSGADLYNAPPMKWIIKGVLPANGLGALYGASGSGKSFLALDMGFAIANGTEWYGRRVTKSPVTYVCLESEGGLGNRVKAWSEHYQKSIQANIHFITQPFDLLSSDVAELAKSVNAVGGANGLIMLDTLNRAAPGADENSSVDMGNIIAAAKRLQSLTGGLVLLVHHTGKDTSKGLRGHSSLYAALDGAIEVTKNDSRREWNVAKSKEDETGAAHAFNLEVVNIGFDDEGDEITSCVAIPNNSMDGELRRILPPKSGNQKIIWQALQEAFKQSPNTGQASAPIGRPCLRLEGAIEKTKDSLVCEPKRQTERTQSAITGLVARGLLAHKEGWLWIV